MKVIATGDGQIDQHSRLDEWKRVHAFIAEHVERTFPDVYLDSGDVYERRSTETERRCVREHLARVAAVCPIIVAGGNHEAPGEVEELNEIPGVRAFERPGMCTIVSGLYTAKVAVLPWPRLAWLLALHGEGKTSGEAHAIAREALRGVLRGFRQQWADHQGPKILMGHWQVDESRIGPDQPLRSCELVLSRDELRMSGADVICGGHIHMPQAWEDPGEAPVIYPGSPGRTAYAKGELVEKGVVEIDFEGTRPIWKRVPTPATPMLLVEAVYLPYVTGDLNDDGGWDEHYGLTVVDAAGTAADDIDVRDPRWTGAEVRLRYTTPADLQGLADDAAKRWAERLRAVGATVKLERRLSIAASSRAPEVAEARTTAAKLDAFWNVRGIVPDETRRAAIMAKLAEIDGEDGGAQLRPLATHGARWRRIRLVGFGPLTCDLDLDELEGPLVAVVGDNGDGKSTLVGAIHGAMYRKLPKGQLLAHWASSRKSVVEAVTDSVTGEPVTLRHMLDGEKGSGKGLVLGADGSPIAAPSGKVTEFDEWAKRHCPDRDVYMASIFKRQGGETFLGMGDTARKDVILRTIGPEIERLETLAERARKRLTRVENEEAAEARAHEEVLSQIPTHRLWLPAVDPEEGVSIEEQLEAAIAGLGREIERLVQEQQRAESALQLARDDQHDLEAAARRRAELIQQRTSVQGRVDAARQERLRAEGELAELHDTLQMGDKIAAAKQRVDEIESRLVRLRQEESDAVQAANSASSALDDARESYRAVAGELQAVAAELTTNQVQIDAEERWLRDAEEQLESLAETRTLAATVDERRREDAAAGERLRAAEVDLERVRGEQLGGLGERITGLRVGLEEISAESVDDPAAHAEATIVADDKVAKAAESHPQRVQAAKDAADEAFREHTAHRQAWSDAESAARKLPRLERIAAEREERRSKLDELRSARGAIEERQTEIGERLKREEQAGAEARRASDDADKAVREAREAVRVAAAEQATARAVAGRAEEYASAKTRAEALIEQLDQVLVRAQAAAKELAALPDPGPEIGKRDLGELERAVTAAAESVERERERRSKLSASLEAVRGLRTRADAILETRNGLLEQASHWRSLADCLGRDGIQGLEIDAAGPELSEIANDLLHQCFGSRYTCSLDTTRPAKGDAEREIEQCRVRVYDAERGRDHDAADLSGGQEVPIDDAYTLAITVLCCRRAGLVNPTLIRDESGASLSPQNSRAWVAMLRRAVELIDAHKLLLVTHSAEVASLCDSGIRVAGGTATPVPAPVVIETGEE